MTGVEALVRWETEDGIHSPAEFIPLAEETGLITALGEQIIDMACKQAKEWVDKGYRIPIAVNLSPKQFQSEDLVSLIRDTITKYQLEPQYLALEVTESMTMENLSRSLHILSLLRDLGVSISIDDFGTGHSSLSYLKDFPINKIKIDKSFIDELTLNNKSDQITSAIIAMCQELNLDVIAEGVETGKQLDFLRSKGCNNVQGYYYSKPLNSSSLEETYLA